MAITQGSASAPSQVTQNLDALLSTSLSNYRKTLTDNIATSNALFLKIQENGTYESVDGGQDLRIPLMYGLATAGWYDGYDQLDLTPTDGITQAIWEWRQLAVPIMISRKEQRQNAQRIIDLLKSKIQQSEIAIKEEFAKALLQGNGSGAIETIKIDPVRGASAIDPLPLLVKKDPTTSTSIGNISQSTQTWWRNQQKSSSATTFDGLLQEVEDLRSLCGKGTGGGPTLWIADRITFNLLKFAVYARYRMIREADAKFFPFENYMLGNAPVVWDEFMPDVQNNTLTPDTGKGTLYALNTKFFNVKYDSASNFISTDMQKPINQDAFVRHILWMGAVCLSNRRKHGVLYNIARSLT